MSLVIKSLIIRLKKLHKFLFPYFLISLFLYFLISCGESEKTPAGSDRYPASITLQINELTEHINNDRTNANLFHERGKLYFKQNNIDQALTDIKVAIKIDSIQAPFYYTLSTIHLANSNAYKSKEALEKCISLNPEHIDALLKIAELYLYSRQYKESREYINRALKVDKHNAKAYFINGMSFLEMGDTTRAIYNFQTTVEQNPDHYNAYMQLGLLFYAKNNKLAIDYLNNALNISPKSIEALYAKAMFYQNNNDTTAAINTYAIILEIDPNYAFAHYNLGYIHYDYLNEYEIALGHFNNAIQSDTTYAEAYYMRGLCYEALGNNTKAVADYKTTLNLKENYELAIQGLNRILD